MSPEPAAPPAEPAATEPAAEDPSVLIIMTEAGDERIRWDPSKPAKVAAARAEWDHYKAKGWIGYRTEDGGRGSVLTEFDPAAREIIMAPAVAGG